MPDVRRLLALPGVDLARRLIKQVLDDAVPDLAAGLAYRFLFALFPFAIFVAALAAFTAGWVGIAHPTRQLIGAVETTSLRTWQTRSGLQLKVVLNEGRPGLLTIGALAALWAASGGITALQRSLNRAYDVPETRNFAHRTGLAIGLTLLGSAGILVAFTTIVGGSLLTQQFVTNLGVAARHVGGRSPWRVGL